MSEYESVPGFGQLVRLSDFNEVGRRVVQRLVPKLPPRRITQPKPNPIPDGWRCDVAPTDFSSVEACCQWFDYTIEALRVLIKIKADHSYEFAAMNRILKGQHARAEVADAFTIVRLFVDKGWLNPPAKPVKKKISFEDAVDILKAVGKWVAAQQPAEERPPAVVRQGVTLDQMAASVSRSKRTLERMVKDGRLPPPDVEGGGGRPHEWWWSSVRPILENEYGRQLPEQFPSQHRPSVAR